MAGKLASPPVTIVQVTFNSVSLCLSLNEGGCLCGP
jgi:hypothetical protein